MPRNNLVSLIDRILLIFSPPFYSSTKSRLVHASGKSFFSFPSCETFSFQRIPPSRNGTSYTIEICIQRGAWRGTVEKQDNRDTFLTNISLVLIYISRWFIFMLLSGRKLEGERKGRRFVRSQVIKKSSLAFCV